MSDYGVVNIPATEGVALAATADYDPGAATSEWFKRARYYAAQAVGNAERAHRRTVERRLDKPSRMWSGSDVVRSYRTNADGERRFRDEAEVLTPHGYRPWLETHAPGRLNGGLVLMAATDAVSTNASSRRLRGKRRVSWISDGSLSEARLNAAPRAASGFAPRGVTRRLLRELFKRPRLEQAILAAIQPERAIDESATGRASSASRAA
jgi:hypothetical protein